MLDPHRRSCNHDIWMNVVSTADLIVVVVVASNLVLDLWMMITTVMHYWQYSHHASWQDLDLECVLFLICDG